PIRTNTDGHLLIRVSVIKKANRQENSMPTLDEALNDSTLRKVLMAWATRTHNDEQFSFLVDYKNKKDAKYIYKNYVMQGATKVVNLAMSDMNVVCNLAKEPK